MQILGRCPPAELRSRRAPNREGTHAGQREDRTGRSESGSGTVGAWARPGGPGCHRPGAEGCGAHGVGVAGRGDRAGRWGCRTRCGCRAPAPSSLRCRAHPPDHRDLPCGDRGRGVAISEPPGRTSRSTRCDRLPFRSRARNDLCRSGTATATRWTRWMSSPSRTGKRTLAAARLGHLKRSVSRNRDSWRPPPTLGWVCG